MTSACARDSWPRAALSRLPENALFALTTNLAEPFDLLKDNRQTAPSFKRGIGRSCANLSLARIGTTRAPQDAGGFSNILGKHCPSLPMFLARRKRSLKSHFGLSDHSCACFENRINIKGRLSRSYVLRSADSLNLARTAWPTKAFPSDHTAPGTRWLSEITESNAFKIQSQSSSEMMRGGRSLIVWLV
jgi:hypothetical protein